MKDSVPESFPNIPEQFANGSEQLSTVPDSQSRSQSQAKATATANADWQAVEAEISRLDIGEAVPLMHDARQRGYQPAELRSIIAYREQHREELGVGALVYRIRNSPPGTLIDKGWPRPTKKAPQDFSRLESTYGTLVAGMKAKELSDAMQRAGILATDSNVAACREPGSTIRNQLLVQIDADASLL